MDKNLFFYPDGFCIATDENNTIVSKILETFEAPETIGLY